MRWGGAEAVHPPGLGKKAVHLPILPLELVRSPENSGRLDDWVDGACEILLGEAVTLGSLLGTRLEPGKEKENSEILVALLRAGFGYSLEPFDPSAGNGESRL